MRMKIYRRISRPFDSELWIPGSKNDAQFAVIPERCSQEAQVRGLGSFFSHLSFPSTALEDNQVESIAMPLSICGCSLIWLKGLPNATFPDAPHHSVLFL
jgi:hypothetical protein